MNNSLIRVASAPDDCKVGGKYFYINTTIMSFIQEEIDIETFRRKMYNLKIYLTTEDAKKIKHNESNCIDYSLYVDDISKYKRCIDQQTLLLDFQKKKEKLTAINFIGIILCSFCCYYEPIFKFAILLLFVNLIMILFSVFSDLYTYKVVFVQNKNEEFH